MSFENAFKQLSKVGLENHTELWGEPKTERAFFEAGAQTRQEEVLKLQDEIDELQKRVKELELINFDSELHFNAAKDHICALQNRIDRALEALEDGSLNQFHQILKGK